jgi:predicted nuclease of predicted toxin-antitoxin system
LRILLDENVDRRLKRDFYEELEVVTVAEAGWAGKKNGELLRLAEDRFDVFVSTDKGIPHQQNVSRFNLAVVLLRAKSNAYEELAMLMGEVNRRMRDTEPGTVLTIPSVPRRTRRGDQGREAPLSAYDHRS